MKNDSFDKITIPSHQLFSLNQLYGWANLNKFLANSKKRKAMRITAQYLEKVGNKNDFYINELVRLHFIWHVKNKRTDPDNISSAGRKIILDAMQFVPVNGHDMMLPRDSFRYIMGFSDDFIFDGMQIVEIKMERVKKENDLSQ